MPLTTHRHPVPSPIPPPLSLIRSLKKKGGQIILSTVPRKTQDAPHTTATCGHRTGGYHSSSSMVDRNTAFSIAERAPVVDTRCCR
jgi:hypothetical protein